MSEVTKSIVEAIHAANENKTKAYDTSATVTRIEGNTAWVHIPGGVDETPVKLTINAKEGDTVQVRVSGGSAWLVGNASAPPTDDTTANTAYYIATDANELAESAGKAASEAWGYAESAHMAAESAETDAADAKASAENASEYAARALGNLSTVQSVSETLTYITQHGTMTLTSDVALDPTHVYFVVDAGGDYTVGGTTYAIVTEPDVADISTYYELTIDESLQNYVGTHLALTTEGLWLLPATSGTNKVLIATGAGSQYTVAGTYLIDSNGDTVASFRADGATMSAQGTEIAHLGYGAGTDSGGGTSDAPFYTFGRRNPSGIVGNFSTAEGRAITASGYCAHAEGYSATASGKHSHAEGEQTTASVTAAHAEGHKSKASATYAHAEGGSTIASNQSSHAEGEQTTASGFAAHSEGHLSTASGDYAHAEGEQTTASGSESHAEGEQTTASGYQSHAEGNLSTASGDYAHAQNQRTTASGDNSHAQNFYTVAASDNQTALGKYNVSDSADTYAVIVGNGTADNARSNALALTWDGDVELYLDTTAASGTDHDLYAAITALGWQSDVIV